MKTNLAIAKYLALLAFFGISLTTSATFAQGTAFTYQGRLASGTNAANGVYDIAIAIWDADNGGTQQGGTFTTNAVPVTNGFFVATFDFGNVFTGEALWLEIAVRTNGAASFTTLAPRQPLTPAPYAVFANTASNLTGTLSPAKLSTGTANISISGSAGTVANGVYTVGSYADPAWLASLSGSKITGTVPAAALGNAWVLTGNAGTTAGANYLGTSDAQPLYLDVNGSPILKLNLNGSLGMGTSTTVGTNSVALGYGNSATGAVSTVSGGYGNVTEPGYSTIAGGQLNLIHSLRKQVTPVTNSYATIGGGYSNQIWSADSVIGGGVANQAGTIAGIETYTGTGHTIGGGNGNVINFFNQDSTIGGGIGNWVDSSESTIAGGSGNAIHWAGGTAGNSIGGGISNQITSIWASTIGGGANNTIYLNSNPFGYATIGGGQSNVVNGGYSVIPGGSENAAAAIYCFAAGQYAKATNHHSFVWSDGSTNTFTTASNQFMVRASGGMIFYSSPDNNAGVQLAAGGGSWASLSDRNSKDSLAPVDPRVILERVTKIPINTWRYKTEAQNVRHLGPMAQDFHAAFGMGEDDRHITTIDSEGVALAAIQGLDQKVESENAALRAENAELKARLERLEKLISEKQ